MKVTGHSRERRSPSTSNRTPGQNAATVLRTRRRVDSRSSAWGRDFGHGDLGDKPRRVHGFALAIEAPSSDLALPCVAGDEQSVFLVENNMTMGLAPRSPMDAKVFVPMAMMASATATSPPRRADAAKDAPRTRPRSYSNSSEDSEAPSTSRSSRRKRAPRDDARYRTELCNKFTETGRCPYGDRCQFAHGPEQLRHVSPRHRNYRTVRCKAFWEEGTCLYGPRCRFVHREAAADESEVDSLQGAVARSKVLLMPSLSPEVIADNVNVEARPPAFLFMAPSAQARSIGLCGRASPRASPVPRFA